MLTKEELEFLNKPQVKKISYRNIFIWMLISFIVMWLGVGLVIPVLA